MHGKGVASVINTNVFDVRVATRVPSPGTAHAAAIPAAAGKHRVAAATAASVRLNVDT